MRSTHKLALAGAAVLICVALALLQLSAGASRERADAATPSVVAPPRVAAAPTTELDPAARSALEPAERPAARAAVVEPAGAQRSVDLAAAPTTATVAVRVVDESGVGVSGASVVLARSPAEVEAARLAEERSYRPIQGRTDAEGRAQLEVPAGRPLELSGGKFDASSNETVTVAALAPGETAEVLIEVRTRDDVEVVGRVIEADSGAPIVGARVYAERSAGFISSSRSRAVRIPPTRDPDAVTDADGQFRVTSQSWVTTTALIAAEGRSPRMAALRGNDATADSSAGPVVIELARAARIEGTVRGAPRGAEVRAEVKGYELFDSGATVSLSVRLGVDSFVSAVITDAGTFALEDVPAGARAKLSVYDPAQKKTVFAEPEPVSTAAGVTHRVDWVIGGGGRFVALVREVDGSPAVGQEVWLLSQGPARPGLVESYWEPTARSKSDAAGLAVFSDVAAGTWIVGLAPDRRASDERAFPAVAVAAEMGAAGGDVALEFTVQRGHYIAGQVLDPDGAPVAAHVTLWDQGYSVYLNGQAGKDGTYRLGPLPLGAFELSAQVFGRNTAPLAPSEAVKAQADDVGVVLRLRPGCAIAVTMVDATTGAPVVAGVSLSQHRVEHGIRMTGGEQSSAQFDGLLPATYTLLAQALDGRAGLLSGIALEAGERREIELQVAPAGTVRVRYSGPSPYVDCRIERDGVALDVDTMQSGAESRFVLPPGRFTLEATIIDRTSTEVPRPKLFEDRRVLEVDAGAELVIDLTLD